MDNLFLFTKVVFSLTTSPITQRNGPSLCLVLIYSGCVSTCSRVMSRFIEYYALVAIQRYFMIRVRFEMNDLPRTKSYKDTIETIFLFH